MYLKSCVLLLHPHTINPLRFCSQPVICIKDSCRDASEELNHEMVRERKEKQGGRERKEEVVWWWWWLSLKEEEKQLAVASL